MNSRENKGKKIAKNTLLLYFRMIFTMAVTLYTSRVVLNVLGESDFGVYNVVGGVVAMFGMFSASFASGITRFMSFEMGKGNLDKLKTIFSTSLTIQIVMSLIVIVLGEILGLWFIHNKMTIDPERIYSATIVLHCSLLTFCVNLLSIPYNASIVAHEDMKAFAYISIVEVALKLAVVYVLIVFSYDKLILYAVLLLLVSAIVRFIYALYCNRFDECRFVLGFDKVLFNEMGSFVAWNSIGAAAAAFRSEGVNILINLYFSPAVNAARGVSFQVNAAVTQFSMNFMKAINPQITKSYASNDRDYMMKLVFYSSKLSFYLLLLLTIGILIRTDYILILWLKNVPNHTVWFVRLMLFYTLLESVSMPLITMVMATGNIKKYQVIVGSIILSILPISWVLLELGFPPESTVGVYIFISFISLAVRLLMLRNMINFDSVHFLKDVVLRCALCFCSTLGICYYLSDFIPYNFGGFIVYLTCTSLICILLVYIIGLSKEERQFVKNKITVLIRKVFKYD